MKVASFAVEKRQLDLVEGYRIAGHTITTATNFLVRIETNTGIVGYGSAAPAEDVTGETDAHCLETLDGALRERIDKQTLRDNPTNLCMELLALSAGAPAACAAVDIALWDIAAKSAELPLAKYLGRMRTPMPTSVTIGICDTKRTLREAAAWLGKGFKVLKIKTGEDVDADIERLQCVRQRFDTDVIIRVDANQGYTLDDARRFLAGTKDLAIELLEQPLVADDLGGAAVLTKESDIPIVADESAVSVADAIRVVKAKAATGINIKLMKCGGLTAAKRIHDIAREAGLGAMLGCNDETRISIAAALHFSMAMPGVRYLDLDGHMDLADDPATGGFKITNGVMNLLAEDGLGVSISH